MRNYAELLDPVRLGSEDGIETVLHDIQQDITETNCLAIVTQILSARRPQSLALLISGIDYDIPIGSWILKRFPSSMVEYKGSPMADLLASLLEFFQSNRLLPGYQQSAIRMEANYDKAESLERKKWLLEECLRALRTPDTWNAIKASVIQGAQQQDGMTELETQSELGYMLPLTQLNESVKEFGAWPIDLSGRADKDLRELRRRDKTTFLVVLKKIRDLSRGDFSNDNQIRINNAHDSIPIFQAKASFHARVVYRVDCIHSSLTEETQCVRIFGAYKPTELMNGMWDTIGKQLARKGKEYRHRCTVRNSLHSDRRHFVPAVFPPMPEENVEDTLVSDLLQVDNDDDLQSILNLQKFVPFSRALLNTIFADIDAVFPLELSLREESIVEHPLSCYVLGRGGTGKTTTMIQKMLWIERSLQINSNGETKARQLFVTQSAPLAKKVEEYFHKMLDSVGLSTKTPEELKTIAANARERPVKKVNLEGADRGYEWDHDLPSSFSELEDRHFPLFIGFDRLCSLLAGEIVKRGTLCQSSNQLALGRMISAPPNENFISYNRFLSAYWSHFDQAVIKRLDPRSVLSELIGVIEGSELAALSPERCLDSDTYGSLSDRINPTFSNARGTIYEIYKRYRKRKCKLGDYDSADRAHFLLRSLQKSSTAGRKLDFLYVDEAQDNLMIDALLLRGLCRNPNGLFWAGDTAQTISSGCSFRFQDLKSMIYRMEEQSDHILLERKHELPQTFCLTVNYRSHTGIVDCAHSVVELIDRYWPYSIDKLAQERGLIMGPPPIFLAGKDTQLNQILFGSGENCTELGANQCIIVRDDFAKKQLQAKEGKSNLILTIYKSKGLEFDDVILVDFFADSPLDEAQWRLLLREDMSGCAAPKFDSVKYIGLCAELKALYVAVTRAKQNLRIVDSSEKALPMKNYWSQRHLVKVYTSNERLRPVAGTSTAEQWAELGQKLFDRKEYSDAAVCFKRASLPNEEKIAGAYALWDDAETQPLAQPGSAAEVHRRQAFRQAADAFLSCAKVNCNPSYFCRSGECFEKGGNPKDAAEAFRRGGDFTKLVSLYQKLGMHDESVAIILDKKHKLKSDIANSAKEAARIHYLNQAESNPEALPKARGLFDSDNSIIEYAERKCLKRACAAISLFLGQLVKAAKYLVEDGQHVKAIELLLQEGDRGSMREASHCIIHALWKEMPFGFGSDVLQNPVIDQLFAFSKRLKNDFLDSAILAKLDMFRALRYSDMPVLLQLGRYFFSNEDFSAAAHCFGRLFQDGSQIFETTLELHELVIVLGDFQMHTQSVAAMARMNPVSSLFAHQLFGLKWRNQRLFVSRNTFFFRSLTESHPKDYKDNEAGVALLKMKIYREVLEEHLLLLLNNQSDSFRKVRALNPCLSQVEKGKCDEESCEGDHGAPSKFDKAWYNLRVRVHLLQMNILHNLASIPHVEDLQQSWAIQLYHVLHPRHYRLGSSSDLDISSIPEFYQCLKALNEWADKQISGRKFCLNPFCLATLLMCLDFRTSFGQVEARFPFVSYKCPQEDQIVSIREAAVILLDADTGGLPSLLKGVEFSQRVVLNALPIDLSIFCDFLDYVCGLAIIHESRRNAQGMLHDVLLPRNWWLKLLAHSTRRVSVPFEAIWTLFETLSMMLQQLLGDEDLKYQPNGINENKCSTTFWDYISRLCRPLCLLAHNMRSNKMREDALTLFGRLSLNSAFASQTVPAACKAYFTSSSWADVVTALYHSTSPSWAEQLLCVRKVYKHSSRWQDHWHRITYVDEHDLLAILQSERADPHRNAATGGWEGSNVEEPIPPAVREVRIDDAVQFADEAQQLGYEIEEAPAPEKLSWPEPAWHTGLLQWVQLISPLYYR